jgi:chromosome segregation protein
VHLRAIRIRGFKSFPDPVEVRLEPGVAVVVGPNGSGKSNVADALLWASGSLSPNELRAEKPDDVLFAGSPGGRQPADYCEVELLFDNEDGAMEGLDFSEVSVSRRLHRGGEGQYLVNRAAVRRTDLVELLADVGLGGSHGSVISQGKVEEILASKPEERRVLIEDAAGLGKFKRRRHRAELKLARVQTQVERARDLETEVKARLRPLALQASAAERAEKLRGEIGGLRARLAELDLAEIQDRLAEIDERSAAATLERKRVDERVEALLVERNRVEDELAGAAGKGEGATAALYRLKSASERLELRREAAVELAERLRAEPPFPRPGRNHQREALREQARLARERLAALEHSLAELEGLPPAARVLAEEGERLALSLLEVEAGHERAVAAALAGRAAAVMAADAPGALALVERVRKGGLGDLTVLLPSNVPRQPGRPPLAGAQPLSSWVKARPGGERVAELLADVWLVSPADLARAELGILVTREGHCYDADRGELRFAGETAEAVLLQLDARRRALAREAEELERKAEEARPEESAPVSVEPLAVLAERLAAALSGAAEAARRFEAPLQARVDAGGTRAGELAAELRRLGAAEAEARRAAAEAGERRAAVDVERARLEAEAAEVRRRLADAGADPGEGDDREELAAKIERLERRREGLGQVNPLAKEEHEREKERLAELVVQREDLEASLKELEELRADLAETVERRFDETFASVSKHFAEVAETLFPGGHGRLRLTEPEDGADAEAGVEVELRPAGKKVTRLSLLSGGEKALGAISFLFALFLARPCPFYLLDEVEAALDDTNIGRFVALLRRYSTHAQFIVVTHQKKTMEAADLLYGVTMGGDGVSQIVSRRLPREAEAAA